MPWNYSQNNGVLRRPDGTVADNKAYAGYGAGKNKHDYESVKSTGPLPCGLYKKTKAITHPTLGPLAIQLLQITPAIRWFDREGFFMHGDSQAHPGNASDGCIVASNAARAEFDASPDQFIEVVS